MLSNSTSADLKFNLLTDNPRRMRAILYNTKMAPIIHSKKAARLNHSNLSRLISMPKIQFFKNAGKNRKTTNDI